MLLMLSIFICKQLTQEKGLFVPLKMNTQPKKPAGIAPTDFNQTAKQTFCL